MIAPVARLGQGVARSIAWLGALARFLFQTLEAARWLPRAGRRVASRVLLKQVWFTALQALPIIVGLDSLTTTARGVATDSRAAIIETIENLSRAAEILEHFAEQISRRPMRMLWGVTPPPPEPDGADEDSTDQEQ